MSGPSVEIRLAASPTVEFALMLEVLYRTLQQSGEIDDQRVRVFVGAPRAQQPAAEAFIDWLHPRMEGILVDPDDFDARSIHATGAARLNESPAADVVILMDADMVVRGSLVDLCSRIASSKLIAGMIAHVPPVDEPGWARAYAACGLAAPTFPYRYSGWDTVRNTNGEVVHTKAPPYFNYGFVIMTADVLELVAAHSQFCLEGVESVFPDLMYRSQMALTLAIERAGVSHSEIGMRYNFANDQHLEELHPVELEHAKIIHLLRRTQGFDKQVTYQSLADLRSFVESGPRDGAVELARRTIAGVLPDVEAITLPPEVVEANWLW